jgi:hypothetical protein
LALVPAAYYQFVIDYTPYVDVIPLSTPDPEFDRAAFAIDFYARERFVWGMVSLIICLIGAIFLEAIYIIVTGRLSIELSTIVSGLIGSFTKAFLMRQKRRGVGATNY